MLIIFDDNSLHKRLAPISLTRPVACIRFGIFTIKETWIKFFDKKFPEISVAYKTEAYLSEKYPYVDSEDCIEIAANIKASTELVSLVLSLKDGEILFVNNRYIAKKGENAAKRIDHKLEQLVFVDALWHIFQKNNEAIAIDFDLIKTTSKSALISDTNRVLGKNQIFIAEGARVEHAILNAEKGPIYIGPNSEIMEGSIIRGPFSLGEHAVIKMGAKIYGATTIGPHCKVGGEISNSVFQAYSNKGHDGFLGNSVVGEWCNFGADTNSSNLKNNYSNVKIYSFEDQKIAPSDIMFCGVLMGDHSKTGINTMLNTATVVGVSANIFGGGFPPKFVPSFTWGGVTKSDRFILEKAFEVAENMMSRRNLTLSQADRTILSYLYTNLA